MNSPRWSKRGSKKNPNDMELLQAIIVGVITGLFSAGAVWGVLKTEIRWMRRDLDEVREHLFGVKQHGN